MKDNELRAVVLQKYYELRRLGPFQWNEVPIEDNFPIKALDELSRVCDQLAEHRLIEWKPTRLRGGVIGGFGKITAFGVDVVEGTATPPITITFDQRQTVSISGSNNIVGNHNSIDIDEMNMAINRSNFSAAEKMDAKSLWQKVSENELLNTVIGSVCGAAAKHTLESTPHPK